MKMTRYSEPQILAILRQTERVRELTTDEQTRLFTTLPQEFHPMVAFALMRGARISTITGLL